MGTSVGTSAAVAVEGSAAASTLARIAPAPMARVPLQPVFQAFSQAPQQSLSVNSNVNPNMNMNMNWNRTVEPFQQQPLFQPPTYRHVWSIEQDRAILMTAQSKGPSQATWNALAATGGACRGASGEEVAARFKWLCDRAKAQKCAKTRAYRREGK